VALPGGWAAGRGFIVSLVSFQSGRKFVARLAAGLVLAAAAVLFLPASSGPARADCQPANPFADGSTVNCTSTGGTQTTSVGTGAENNVTVNIQTDATVDVSASAGASAIFLSNGNTVTNAGTIIAGDNGAGIDVLNGNTVTNRGNIIGGNGAIGIHVCCDNTVVNSGNITVLDAGIGIYASGDRDKITNSGTITVGGGGAYGIAAIGDGLIGGGPGKTTITNSGTIIAGDNSFGILVNTNYNVVNSGLISVGQSGSAIQLVQDSAATNSGTIRVAAGGVAFDLNFGNNNTIVNSGNVYASSGFSINGASDGNTITNTGYMQGTIFLFGANTLTNRGTLIIDDPNAYSGGGFVFMSGGTLINDPTGTIVVRVDPLSNDTYQTDGITLNGGRLHIVVTRGLYENITVYSPGTTGNAPLSACGCTGLTGQFNTVTSSSPFFTATADYSTANEVDVTLTRIAFGSVPGLTPNQRAVGNVLEGGYSTSLTGNAATIYGNILAATSASVLDNLSGQGITGAQNAAFTSGGLFNNTMLIQGVFGSDLGNNAVVVPPPQYAPSPAPSRLVAAGHEAFASLNLNKAPAPTQQPGSVRIWTAAFGATQSLQGQADPGSSAQTVRSAGGVIGIDWQAAWDLRVGIAAGGSESSFSVTDLQTSGRITGGHIGAYAKKTWDAWYAAASELCALQQLDDAHDHRRRRHRGGFGPLRQRPVRRAVRDRPEARLCRRQCHAVRRGRARGAVAARLHRDRKHIGTDRRLADHVLAANLCRRAGRRPHPDARGRGVRALFAGVMGA
jgi:uncharacterized protein with beta-barrel porin domain